MKFVSALVCALLLTAAPATSASAGGGVRRDDGASSTAAPAPDAGQAVSVGYADPVAPHGFFWQLFTPQPVLPGAYLYALPASHATGKTKGTRSDQQFFEISNTGSNDVPEAALRAYRHAASTMAKTDPSCQISWTLLAAIGRVESNHGRFGGSQLGSDGVSRPAIVGPRLDGAGPFAAIHDTDAGTLDGDKQWDRAIGQMQFLPGTWRSVARDGDGDGVQNPGDIDDSALASAVYLCGAGNLSTDAGMARAAFRYNQSDYYVALVLAFTHGFQTGVFTLPSPPPPPGQENKAAKVEQVAAVQTKGATTTTKPAVSRPRATSTAAPKTPTVTRPSSTPKPSAPPPSPTQDPTPAVELETVTGTWTACDGGFCLDTQKLDLGDGRLDNAAAADFDGQNGTQTNALEFAGLVGQPVTLRVKKGTGVVYVIGGNGYRNADGSFAV